MDESDPAVTLVARTPRIASGGTATVAFVAAPGTYVLVCAVPHHYVWEQMVATLTVT